MVRMFSPCYFHVIISIGILESNSLSLSTPGRTKWTLVNLLEWFDNIMGGWVLSMAGGVYVCALVRVYTHADILP